jgi:hypothetical protein
VGCALVLGGFGAGFEGDVVSEGLELFDGSGFGFGGVVSGVVVSFLSLSVTPRRRENGVGSPVDADASLGCEAR